MRRRIKLPLVMSALLIFLGPAFDRSYAMVPPGEEFRMRLLDPTGQLIDEIRALHQKPPYPPLPKGESKGARGAASTVKRAGRLDSS